jgi:hypothetical protein
MLQVAMDLLLVNSFLQQPQVPVELLDSLMTTAPPQQALHVRRCYQGWAGRQSVGETQLTTQTLIISMSARLTRSASI